MQFKYNGYEEGFFFFYGFSLYIPIVQIRSTIVAQPIPWDHFFWYKFNSTLPWDASAKIKLF